MNRTRMLSMAAVTALLVGSLPAAAQNVDINIDDQRTDRRTTAPQPMQQQQQQQGALFTDFGTALFVGGGVTGFTQPGVTDQAQPGGYWDVRGVAGTRTPIGVELAYTGTARDINALGLQDEAFLLSNGLEGMLRLQAPITQGDIDTAGMTGQAPLLVSPYAFGGLGYTRYDLVNEGTNTSNVQGQDDIMSLPLGVGVGLGLAGVTLDARFTYRHAFFSDLVGNATSSFDDVALNQWNVGASLGFEF